MQSRESNANVRVDWQEDEWGRRTAVYRLAADDPRNFTFPMSLLLHAARKVLNSPDRDVPSLEETMYQSNDWETQVLLTVDNLNWARDTLKGT